MRPALIRYLPLLILAVAWEAVARLGLVSSLASPPLSKVVAAWIDLLRDVVLPSALPELLNGIRTALALAFILLVSSELIVAQQGFGYLIGFLGASGAYEGMY